MTLNNNEAEVAITMKAKDEASEEMEAVRDQAKGMDKDFNLLSKSMVATTLGFFGLSFGMTKTFDAVMEARDSVLQIDSAIAVLGPNAEETMAKFEPAIGTLGDIMKVADQDVRAALTNMLRGSGGIEPTAQDIITAFALAEGFGIPIEQASESVGLALRGVMDSVNQIVDPTGMNPVDSLEELYDDLVGVFLDSRTSLDDITKVWNELWNAVLGKNTTPKPGGGLSDIPGDVLLAVADPMSQVPDFLLDPNSEEAKRRERFKELGEASRIENLWKELNAGGAFGIDDFDTLLRSGGKAPKLIDEIGKTIVSIVDSDLGRSSTVNGSQGVVININTPTGEERRQQILDEVNKALDEALRRAGGLDGSMGR